MAPKRCASTELEDTRQGHQADIQQLMNFNNTHNFPSDDHGDLNYDNGYVNNQDSAGLSTQQYGQPLQQSQYDIPSQHRQLNYMQDPQQQYPVHYDAPIQSSENLAIAVSTRSGASTSGARRPQKTKPRSRARGRFSEPTMLSSRDGVAELSEETLSHRPVEIPLSQIEKDFPELDLPNIEEFAYRLIEVRREERMENPGKKIKRPLNPFILYRKKYRPLAKEWGNIKNEQIVSKVVGKSWAMESQAVKDQFIAWGKGESDNHRVAHPEFRHLSHSAKGKGKKTGKNRSKRPRPVEVSDEISEGTPDYLPEDILNSLSPNSENEFHEYDWRQGRVVRKKATQSGFEPTNVGMAGQSLYAGQGLSTYGHSNPGQVPPAQYDETNLPPGQYLQQTVQLGRQYGVEDVMVRPATRPGLKIVALPEQSPYIVTDHNLEPLDISSNNIDPNLIGGGEEFTGSFFQDNAWYNDQYNFPNGSQQGRGAWDIQEQSEEVPQTIADEAD